MHDKVLNDDFVEFFTSLGNSEPPYPELLKVRLIEHNITRYIHVVMCYAHDLKQYYGMFPTGLSMTSSIFFHTIYI